MTEFEILEFRIEILFKVSSSRAGLEASMVRKVMIRKLVPAKAEYYAACVF